MLSRLAPSVYWMAPDHTTDRPIVAAIGGEHATLMVEAGNSVKHAHQFLNALAAQPVAPLRYVVLTHWHWDHVFGAPAIDAIAIATEETRRQIEIMAGYSWSDAALDERTAAGLEIPFCRDMIKAELSPAERAELTLRVPELAFRAEMTIDLGNQIVRVIHVGGDHSSDSCIVVLPGVVAFLSDCVYPNLHVEPNYFSRRHLFPLLDRLLTLDVEHYVLGHDDAPLSRAAFESLARSMKKAGDAVKRHGLDDDGIQAELAAPGTGEDGVKALQFVKAFQAGLVHEVDGAP